jgi:DNA-binding response OmpR family regulator
MGPEIATIRRAVRRMPAPEAAAYLMEVVEQLTGQDEPIEREVCGRRLTPQQALVFAMLKRNMGHLIHRDRILAMLTAGQIAADVNTTTNSAAVVICGLRKLLAGHFEIETIWRTGYRMRPIHSDGPAAWPEGAFYDIGGDG